MQCPNRVKYSAKYLVGWPYVFAIAGSLGRAGLQTREEGAATID
jgi:hypothetical protein